jgi:hypothetical protein
MKRKRIGKGAAPAPWRSSPAAVVVGWKESRAEMVSVSKEAERACRVAIGPS